MASTPERQNTPKPECFSLVDSVWDHTMLAPLFVGWLVTHPRKVLKVLQTEGVAGINNGYNNFFDNTRPILH